MNSILILCVSICSFRCFLTNIATEAFYNQITINLDFTKWLNGFLQISERERERGSHHLNKCKGALPLFGIMPCIYSNHLLCQLPSIFPSFILISPQSSLWLFFSCSFFPSHLPRNLPTNRPSLFQKLSKIYIFISREADKKNFVQINIKKNH